MSKRKRRSSSAAQLEMAYNGRAVIEVGARHGPVVRGDETLDEPEVLACGRNQTGEHGPHAPAVGGDLGGDGSGSGNSAAALMTGQPR